MGREWRCETCGVPIDDYEPRYCCDGRMCGCRGEPIDPPLCSGECGAVLFAGPGSIAERRAAAGIPDRRAMAAVHQVRPDEP